MRVDNDMSVRADWVGGVQSADYLHTVSKYKVEEA